MIQSNEMKNNHRCVAMQPQHNQQYNSDLGFQHFRIRSSDIVSISPKVEVDSASLRIQPRTD